jgi:hypothetical protein
VIKNLTHLKLASSFVGEEISHGPLPAFFYFSLSAEESLGLHPYNTPVQILKSLPLRIFSFTLPGHEEGRDKFAAMKYWAEELSRGHDILEEFFEKLESDIETLIAQNIIDASKMVCGGLSRGAFIATHLAAREQRISHVLGFAPLTRLNEVDDFAEAPSSISEKNLDHLTSKLLHLKALRFYIGNRDLKVSTDACYDFIKKFAEEAHEKRARECQVELVVTNSIGYKGHGTAPHIFEEGSRWLASQLYTK